MDGWTYRVVAHELGQDEADVPPLARQRSVGVAVVVLLIAQREDGRQRVQLGGDVRVQDVRAVLSVCVRSAVSISLQQLPEEQRRDLRLAAI